jgi:hypothetical protein
MLNEFLWGNVLLEDGDRNQVVKKAGELTAQDRVQWSGLWYHRR